MTGPTVQYVIVNFFGSPASCMYSLSLHQSTQDTLTVIVLLLSIICVNWPSLSYVNDKLRSSSLLKRFVKSSLKSSKRSAVILSPTHQFKLFSLVYANTILCKKRNKIMQQWLLRLLSMFHWLILFRSYLYVKEGIHYLQYQQHRQQRYQLQDMCFPALHLAQRICPGMQCCQLHICL